MPPERNSKRYGNNCLPATQTTTKKLHLHQFSLAKKTHWNSGGTIKKHQKTSKIGEFTHIKKKKHTHKTYLNLPCSQVLQPACRICSSSLGAKALAKRPSSAARKSAVAASDRNRWKTQPFRDNFTIFYHISLEYVDFPPRTRSLDVRVWRSLGDDVWVIFLGWLQGFLDFTWFQLISHQSPACFLKSSNWTESKSWRQRWFSSPLRPIPVRRFDRGQPSWQSRGLVPGFRPAMVDQPPIGVEVIVFVCFCPPFLDLISMWLGPKMWVYPKFGQHVPWKNDVWIIKPDGVPIMFHTSHLIGHVTLHHMKYLHCISLISILVDLVLPYSCHFDKSRGAL